MTADTRNKRPWHHLQRAAEDEVQALLKVLPRPVREKVRALPIILQPAPTPDQVRDSVEPDLLGLFLGNAYHEGADYPEPTEIILFLENIWQDSDCDESEYRVQVRDTLLHEIGHYLGLEEDGLAARDLE